MKRSMKYEENGTRRVNAVQPLKLFNIFGN